METINWARVLSRDWLRFQRRLGRVMLGMDVEDYLIVAWRGHHRFVQFAFVGDDDGRRAGIRAETISNHFLVEGEDELLTADQERRLLVLGWQAPSPVLPGDDRAATELENPNYWLRRPVPVDVTELASLAVRTLTQVYGVVGPADLDYKAFRSEGPRYVIPELGIREEDGMTLEDVKRH
jgi:hypothetical protein